MKTPGTFNRRIKRPTFLDKTSDIMVEEDDVVLSVGVAELLTLIELKLAKKTLGELHKCRPDNRLKMLNIFEAMD